MLRAWSISSEEWSNHYQVSGCVPYEKRIFAMSEYQMTFGRVTNHCL